MSVPSSRRGNSIASTPLFALAAEEAVDQVARGLAQVTAAEERARHGGREGRVGRDLRVAHGSAGAERDGEPVARVDQHRTRLRLAEHVVGEGRGGDETEGRIQLAD